MRKLPLIFWSLLFFWIVQVGLIAVSEAQYATNAQRDLYGENLGDQIMLQWDLEDNTHEYFVYRSTSLNGPWTQIAKVRESAARTGGSKVDVTPDAKLMDLCYKVEAIDANGIVLRNYTPICVPQFVQLK
jgi:hypothetical protein